MAKKTRATKRPARDTRRAVPPPPPQFPDRRALEKATADMARLLRSREFSSADEMDAFLQSAMKSGAEPPDPDTPLERAQEVMYEAWGASGDQRVALARKALEISPDCADAYVLLAEETATSYQEAKDLYHKGVAAGKRALGPEFFEENAGHFWGILETRPYMRALEGLAESLWALGESGKAAELLEEMLRLNPGDNQGVRYTLARLLLAADEDGRLGRLLDRYPDDASAEWRYTRALQRFRAEGQSDAANQALFEAFESNPLVTLYIFGLKELPDRPPPYYSPGDENEAMLYVGYSGMAWLETSGAIEWFAGHVERAAGKVASGPAPAPRRKAAKSRAAPARQAPGKAIYQLKVTLRGSKPPIWRRLLVPADTKLSKLHDILQTAMGWTDSHLHMFGVRDTHYGIPNPDDWDEVLDERKVTLAEVLPRERAKLVYEYDFGDGWEHDVLVEKVLDAEPGVKYPACVAGKRACPPEDCGGVWGYANLVEAVNDPEHPEHDEMLEWLGGGFDPEAFDVERVSRALQRRRR
jgi:tetratricopeptide (TPR) repeat protein